jgi:hypothetical protein
VIEVHRDSRRVTPRFSLSGNQSALLKINLLRRTPDHTISSESF